MCWREHHAICGGRALHVGDYLGGLDSQPFRLRSSGNEELSLIKCHPIELLRRREETEIEIWARVIWSGLRQTRTRLWCSALHRGGTTYRSCVYSPGTEPISTHNVENIPTRWRARDHAPPPRAQFQRQPTYRIFI